jgi:hypothetical protein
MDIMEVTLFKKNSLIFFEKHKVYVIISGEVLMKNHERNIILPQTYAKFR